MPARGWRAGPRRPRSCPHVPSGSTCRRRRRCSHGRPGHGTLLPMRVRRAARGDALSVGGCCPSVSSSSPLLGVVGDGAVGGRPVHGVVCDSAGVDGASCGAAAAGASMSAQLSGVVPCAQHCGASEIWRSGSSCAAGLKNQPEDQDAPQRHGKPSYKEVLLRQRGSVHQEGQSRNQGGDSWPVEDYATVKVLQQGRSEESWHVAKAKSQRLCTKPRQDSEARQQKEQRSLYMQKMKGLCFNCLGQDHKVASCRNPTRCWRCRRFGHVSKECPSRQLVHPLSNFSQDLGGTMSQPHITGDADTFIDDVLLHIAHNLQPTVSERSPDPMLLEALLSERQDTGVDHSTPPATATPLHVDNQHHLREELRTPVLLRSEAEQLVGKELIKAMRDFKQMVVAPLSPHSRQNASHEKDPVVVCTEGTTSSSHHRKTKIKSRKRVFKVTRDLLTKKWIFVKREKQLRALPKVTNLLEELRLPPQLWSALVG